MFGLNFKKLSVFLSESLRVSSINPFLKDRWIGSHREYYNQSPTNSVIKHKCHDMEEFETNFFQRIKYKYYSKSQIIYNNTFQDNKVRMLAKTKGESHSQSKYAATVVEGKLFLQINDDTTYKGILDINPYYDIKQLKECFQKGQFQVITKTTSKICIKLAFLKLQLQSEMSYQLEELRKQVQELEEKLKTAGKWEVQDLDSKANFDRDYIYRIENSGGFSTISVSVTSSTLTFIYSSNSPDSVSSGNRRYNNSTGYTVTKMMKYKI